MAVFVSARNIRTTYSAVNLCQIVEICVKYPDLFLQYYNTITPVIEKK